jgi:FkbM family methyltransferase
VPAFLIAHHQVSSIGNGRYVALGLNGRNTIFTGSTSRIVNIKAIAVARTEPEVAKSGCALIGLANRAPSATGVSQGRCRMPASTRVHTELWRPSRLTSILAAVAYPVIFVLNRPSLAWFADVMYDFALRCSGIAITFAGTSGLTRAEERFLQRHKALLQGGTLFDVGANHGAYARMLHNLAPTARVIAFEPHPTTFAVLQDLTRDMRPVSLINKAVGDQVGRLKLYDFRFCDGSTQASLSEAAIGLYSDDIVEHPVECITIDAFMAESGIDRVDLLRIDTEGHDLAVLKGARNALRDRRIKMIQFEFIPANITTGVTMRDFFEVLRGYRINRLCLNGMLRPLERYDVKRCEIYITQNLIAVAADEPS